MNEQEKPYFDTALQDIYAAGIADIIRRNADNLSRFLDLPRVPPTRWQRVKWKLRSWRYDIRHSVCCSHDDY